MLVDNIRSGEIVEAKQRRLVSTGDWQSVASQRGFVQLLEMLSHAGDWIEKWRMCDLMTHYWLSEIERELLCNDAQHYQFTITKEVLS
ncbi:hypothetical protein [Salinibius halmophilus]|uniref:hypothetical protein n=1 Tax=Salinibius halmophilus TaxID=1853216 RepID=UPI000E66D70A|nr:hypothetical protein [Salinibius halmophilus]